MSQHPLWSLSDLELEALCEAGHAPESLRVAFRVARATPPDPATSQRLLAAFHGICAIPDGFRWPWVGIDSQLGLLPMGELAVVLGQTGNGKTTFTSSLLNRLSTVPTLVFATETPAERYLTQLASRRANLHPDLVVQGQWGRAGFRMDAPTARQRYAEALSQLEAAPLTIAPELSLKASAMQTALVRACDRATDTPQVVIVDHFQAIQHDLADGVKGTQETLNVLHQFAYDHYLTLIVTNQAHLKGNGVTPKPHHCIDTAGNFGGQTLMQYAAQVIGLHRVLVGEHNGVAVTGKFVQEFERGGGNVRELYDRSRVAVDLCKVRYDGGGVVGSEVRLKYVNGAYKDIEEGE